ncbi:DUF1294 domain-containing protein [Halobacillus massiliensis]|uniref:DUF1294 domain-containing protein n=1 Tax=Halobacillus massiliensis TaxID=1926286 RepID=UPI0009E358D3|nr:DUF1294 domain-containing protein [Halobacillus massiliensis]
MELIVILYLLIVSLFEFFLMGYDKKRAREGKWRVSEKTFWLLAAAGGAAGGFLGMYVFRHKTKHVSFVIGMPLVAVAQLYMLSTMNWF